MMLSYTPSIMPEGDLARMELDPEFKLVSSMTSALRMMFWKPMREAALSGNRDMPPSIVVHWKC